MDERITLSPKNHSQYFQFKFRTILPVIKIPYQEDTGGIGSPISENPALFIFKETKIIVPASKIL